MCVCVFSLFLSVVSFYPVVCRWRIHQYSRHVRRRGPRWTLVRFFSSFIILLVFVHRLWGLSRLLFGSLHQLLLSHSSSPSPPPMGIVKTKNNKILVSVKQRFFFFSSLSADSALADVPRSYFFITRNFCVVV